MQCNFVVETVRTLNNFARQKLSCQDISSCWKHEVPEETV